MIRSAILMAGGSQTEPKPSQQEQEAAREQRRQSEQPGHSDKSGSGNSLGDGSSGQGSREDEVDGGATGK